MTPSTSTTTVLVLGANGRFGAAAVQAFADAGWRVLAQQRRPAPAPLPAGAQALLAPLQDTAAIARRAAGAGVVVHAVNPAYADWDTQALPALRQGLDVAQHLGALFMLPGNVYNFGEGMPALLREDTPERPSTGKGRIRCAMEAEMAARGSTGLRSVVIRAGDFFGAGLGTWFDQAIVKDLARGKLVYPGPRDQPHAWAYLPDLAQAFVAVAGRPPAAPGLERLHFAGHTVTGDELLAGLQHAAAALGISPAAGWRTGGLPWALIRLGSLLVPEWRGLAEMAYLWRVPHALDGRALAQRAGPLPSTPLAEALRRSLIDLGLARAHPAGPLAA